MRCPFCGFQDDKVIDSRSAEEGSAIRRRRECMKCGRRFTTYETIDADPILVVKSNGTRQQFMRTKIKNGILKACEKRPVSAQAIEEAVEDIEKQLYNQNQPEVKASDIGELVMEKLKVLDKVAYIRFASVYRDFSDISAFTQYIKDLEKTKKKDK